MRRISSSRPPVHLLQPVLELVVEDHVAVEPQESEEREPGSSASSSASPASSTQPAASIAPSRTSMSYAIISRPTCRSPRATDQVSAIKPIGALGRSAPHWGRWRAGDSGGRSLWSTWTSPMERALGRLPSSIDRGRRIQEVVGEDDAVVVRRGFAGQRPRWRRCCRQDRRCSSGPGGCCWGRSGGGEVQQPVRELVVLVGRGGAVSVVDAL